MGTWWGVFLAGAALTVAATQPAPRPYLPIDQTPPVASVVVERGDSLWRLAAAELRRLDPDSTLEEIRAYWRLVVEANRHRVRSGEPDLIYPGEVIVLPSAPG